jgi:hypothetical protein
MTAMGLTMAQARGLWSGLKLAVDDGLTQAEFRRVEKGLDFAFNPDHRVLLSSGLPRGGRWPDWRAESLTQLRERLDEPVAGVLFDVAENGFWHASWGKRPPDVKTAVRQAKSGMKSAPLLVPIYGHRFAPALPEADLPVFSVVQTDVIVYGSTIGDYLRREFGRATDAELTPAKTVAFWSELVGAVENR